MKKMNSPELEVIHFNTEDVIVTSGVGYKSLSPGRSYFTLGYEMDEAFPDAEVFSKKNFYKLYYDIDSSALKFSTTYDPITNIDENNDYYAWYDVGNWFTEDKRKNDYLVDNTYKWIRNNTN